MSDNQKLTKTNSSSCREYKPRERLTVQKILELNRLERMEGMKKVESDVNKEVHQVEKSLETMKIFQEHY